MSDAQNQSEPTMEEILASIRKIISDDGSTEQAKEQKEEKTPLEPEAAAPPEPESPTEGTEEPESPTEGAEEPEPSPGPETVAAAEEGEDVLDLTEMVGADGSVVELEEQGDEGMPAEEEQEGPAVFEDEEIEIRPAKPFADEEDEEIFMTAAPEDQPDDASILEPPTRAAATASLSDLADAIGLGPRQATPLGGGKTLEALVREAIEPYLKSWLDENLPALVERIVRDEIKKMVRRAEYR